MSTVDLMILGILSKQPMSAYDITRYVEDNEVTRLLKISAPAIFKSCIRLAKSDYLIGKSVQVGAYPEKLSYKVSTKGKKRFLELMENYSANFKPFFIEFNTFIWNLENVEKAEGLKMLANLKTKIKELNAWIKEHQQEVSMSKGFAVKMIIKQYVMTIQSLVDWIDIVTKEYKKL